MNMHVMIIALFVIAVVFVILFGRRMSASYGSLTPDDRVLRSFESFEVKPNLSYYTSGAVTCPTAIMGVANHVSLDSRLWGKRVFTKDELVTIVQNMQGKAAELDRTLHGFRILDNKGRYLGEWYSVLGITATVKVKKDGRIMITTPPPDIYNRR